MVGKIIFNRYSNPEKFFKKFYRFEKKFLKILYGFK